MIEDSEAGAQVCITLSGEVDRTIKVFVSTSDGSAIGIAMYNIQYASLYIYEERDKDS